MTAARHAEHGHNSGAAPEIRIEVRMFNSLSDFGEGIPRTAGFAAGTTVGDLIRHYRLPLDRVFLVLVNGRDVTREMGRVNVHRELEDGDVIAFSGPVPYSWGYGAPVV